MMPLQKLSVEWLEAKEAERDATERRRLIEDEMVRLIGIEQTDEHTRKVEADPFTIKIACRKRPVEEERIERIVNSIQRRLESMGEAEIASSSIGEMVMEALQGLDKVAYVRFASVYKNFREVKDFESFVDSISEPTKRDEDL